MDTILVKFDAARRAIAEARSIDEIKQIRDKAEALRLYVKQQGESLEMQNDIAEIKLRAERRAGELLAEIERVKLSDRNRPDLQQDRATYTQTIRENNVSSQTAHNWQRIAALPEDTFERTIIETKSNGDELTSAGMLRVAKGQAMQVHYSSEKEQWNTPQLIIDRVLQVLETITLDPCSDSEDNPNIPAECVYTEADDGLSHPWFDKVYMNPPYGDVINQWVEKLIDDYENGNVTEAIALVPARTDTRWFRQLRDYPRCFVWGRLRFSNTTNSAPFPSMVVYLGERLTAFADVFEDIGDIYIAYE